MGQVDYHPVPEWLTVEYLEPILRKYQQDESLQISDLKAKPVTAKGENYASVMTRLCVDYNCDAHKDTHTGYYIVKTTYENDEYVSSLMAPYQVSKTEMRMYEKILPKLSALLHEIGDTDKLFADTIHVDYEHEAIIFEDLAVKNFVTADRLAGMNTEETKLALKKLAKMHATAAVLNERQPGSLECFQRGIFNRHTSGFAPFFKNMFGVCAQFAAETPELGEYYTEKLVKLKDRVVEYATRVHDLKAGHFHTLNHGDYWVNNVMLRYEEQGANGSIQKIAKDMMLIDFQFCNWGSPAVDLHYFLNTSLNSELRFHHQDALLKYYHNILSETLQHLHYSGHIPTLHEFCVQMEAGRFYALFSSLVSQPLMINDNTDDADFRALMIDDERGRNFRNIVYTNKVTQEYVKKLLPYFDCKGLLDVTD